MKKVFVATAGAEAHLVKGLLESHGIDAMVRGEDLLGAGGEVPIPDVWPTVWIAEDEREEEARALVASFQAERPSASAPGWRCPRCAQELEAQFTACWQCGAERPTTRAE